MHIPLTKSQLVEIEDFYSALEKSEKQDQAGFSVDIAGGSDSKVSAYNVGDPGSIPGSGRSLEKGLATQYPCLKNSMDRGAWWATE